MRGARRGAIIQVVTNHLRVNTPAGVVTAADPAALAEHKTELIVMLGGPVARGERVESACWVLRRRPSCAFCHTPTRVGFVPDASAAQPAPVQDNPSVCCTLEAIEGRGRR